MALDPGRRLGAYEILEPIGAGGMGEVYRARDTKLGRDVAIKVLPGEVSDSPERLARFEREAQLLASLNHPNIATVHGLEQADGIHYLVMELVPGETLAEMLVRGPIAVDDAVALIRQIIDGLEAAHENGVVHRDLKPANIIVTSDGVVKILDFGLAKAFEPEGAEVDSSLSPTITRDGTQAGVILGTAAYMSPEQARGKPVDKRTDIFSFGSVLFEMLSGKKAFDGEMISDILAAVIKLEPDWSKLPSSRLDALVRRCLEKDPKRRLRDIGDARVELEDTSMPEPPGSRPRYLPWLGLAAGIAAGLTAALGLVGRSTSPAPAKVIRFSVPRPPSGLNFAVPMHALSPDGSKLAQLGGGNLFVRYMERDEMERIPISASGRNPFFSPDGEWVGFFSEGKLKKISLSGGSTETIADIAPILGADWGQDDSIVFAVRNSGIWRVSANGGEPELVVEVEGAGYPELIGDGRVLFATLGSDSASEPPQIMAATLDTGAVKSLNLRGTQPRYLPSGHLVFVEGGRLRAVAFDCGGLEVRGAPVTFVEGLTDPGGILVAHYAISDSGSLAYFVLAPTRQLAWVDRRGNTVSAMREQRGYADLRLSPDGGSVALFDLSAALDIWNYNVARETFTRLSLSAMTDEVPVWSPDGRSVAYTTAVAGGGRILHRRAADGSGSEAALWTSPYHTHVSDWTSDGSTLVLNENRDTAGTGWDILVLDADGEPSPKYLLESRFDEINPRLHPQGQWLAYMSDETGQREIYVTSFPEPGDKHAISSGGGFEPVWSKDGSELFYRNGTDIMAVNVTAGAEFSYENPVALFRDSFEDAAGVSHTAYDVHPDGRFLFVVRPDADEEDPYRGLSRYQIVVNWMTEVEQRVPAP